MTSKAFLFAIYAFTLGFCYASKHDTVSDLIHVPLTRQPVPNSQAFSFHRRQWMIHLRQQLTLDPSHPPTAFPPAGFRLFNASFHAAVPATPLQGGLSPLGEYYVTLTFDGQPINVQVDTGSSTMAVPLKQCTNCRANDHRFDLRKASKTSGMLSCDSKHCRANYCSTSCGGCSSSHACCSRNARNACAFTLRYADQSGASGALVSSTVGISTLATGLLFGGILEETESFENVDVDGIFGLAYKALACNPTCVLPLFDTLVDNGQVKRDVFSICTGSQGGVLTLGGSNPALYHEPMSYVPIHHTSVPQFYRVRILGAHINGQQVNIPHFTMGIVDSGTTLLVMATGAYRAIRNYFQTHFCEVPGLCEGSRDRQAVVRTESDPRLTDRFVLKNSDHTSAFKEDIREPTWFSPGYCVILSDAQVEMLPTISIKLEGIVLELEPSLYMFKHKVPNTLGSTTYRCLGLISLAGLEQMPNNVIIGDTVLRKYFIEYDRANSRVGFAIAKKCVDPTAVEAAHTQPTAPGTTRKSGSWWKGLFYVASAIGWVFIIIMCAGWRQQSSGYQRIPTVGG